MDMHLEAGIFVRKNPNIAIAKAISVAMGTVSAARLCVHVCVYVDVIVCVSLALSAIVSVHTYTRQVQLQLHIQTGAPSTTHDRRSCPEIRVSREIKTFS